MAVTSTAMTVGSLIRRNVQAVEAVGEQKPQVRDDQFEVNKLDIAVPSENAQARQANCLLVPRDTRQKD